MQMESLSLVTDKRWRGHIYYYANLQGSWIAPLLLRKGRSIHSRKVILSMVKCRKQVSNDKFLLSRYVISQLYAGK